MHITLCELLSLNIIIMLTAPSNRSSLLMTHIMHPLKRWSTHLLKETFRNAADGWISLYSCLTRVLWELLSQRAHTAQLCRQLERQTGSFCSIVLHSPHTAGQEIGTSCQSKRNYFWHLPIGMHKERHAYRMNSSWSLWLGLKTSSHKLEFFLKSQHNFRFHHHFLKVPSGKIGLSPNF
jgi:hypothetical protein